MATKSRKGIGGRPSKLTPEVQENVVSAVKAGNYAHVAAAYAGISEGTYYGWMKRGREEGRGKYFEFLEAVKKAEGEAEVRAVAMVHKHMHDNWTAAMTFLERKFPDRWAHRQRLDVTSGNEPVRGVLLVPAEMTVEEWLAEGGQGEEAD